MHRILRKRAASDDATLVRAVTRNRTDLFAVLVDRYLDGIRTFAALRTTSRERADEAVRAAFVHAFHHLETWDPATPFAHWLQGLATGHLEHRPSPSPRTETILDALDRTLSPLPVDADLRRSLQQSIARLPGPIRHLLILHYNENLSVDQIAQRENQSAAWVGTVLYRTRQALANGLGGREP